VTREPVTDGRYLAHVGFRVRTARRWPGIRQDELAELAGVSRVTLSSIERGEHPAGVLTYLKIARALGVRMGDLLNEETS
jgi:DNA-binding XRE family transcriptional regulator